MVKNGRWKEDEDEKGEGEREKERKGKIYTLYSIV